MTNPNSGNVPISSHEQHWPIAIAALAVGTAFFSLWFWLLPQWIGFHVEAGTAHWRWLASFTVSIGIRGCSALRLGFWLDRARNSGPDCAATAPSGCWLLPLRAQSHVRGVRNGLDRAMDYLWTHQPTLDCRCRSSCSWRASFRDPIRRTDAPPEIWC
jgi:hypothetical protein